MTRFAGNVSVNPTPVCARAPATLAIVKVSVEDWFAATVDGLKALVSFGRTVLLTLQATLLPGPMAAASSVMVPACVVATVPPFMPEHVADCSTSPAASVSVSVVTVFALESVCVAPATPVPDVTVVIVWLAQPLLPVKVYPPTEPLLTLVSVSVGCLVLTTVQL